MFEKRRRDVDRRPSSAVGERDDVSLGSSGRRDPPFRITTKPLVNAVNRSSSFGARRLVERCASRADGGGDGGGGGGGGGGGSVGGMVVPKSRRPSKWWWKW